MLEQPPERNLLEIQAEAAAAQDQIEPTHGCLRVLVWLTPLAVTVIVTVLAIVLSYLLKMQWMHNDSQLFIFAGCIALSASFGIGLIDALLSSTVRAVTNETRNTKIIMHAVQFMLYQILIIPLLSVLITQFLKMIFLNL